MHPVVAVFKLNQEFKKEIVDKKGLITIILN